MNKRTAPMQRSLPRQNYFDPFLPPRLKQNVHHHANKYQGQYQFIKQHGYEHSRHAGPSNAKSNTNRQISSVCNPFEQSLLKMLRLERVVRCVEKTLEPILKFTEFPEDFLTNVLLPCIPSEKAGILVAGVLLCASKKKGTDEIGKLWRESQLRWIDLFGNHPYEDFIKKNELEFTINPYYVNKNYCELIGPDRTIKQMERMGKLVTAEFLHKNNITETIECIIELASPRTVHVFIYTAINEVLKQCSSDGCHSDKANSLGLIKNNRDKARSLGLLFVRLQERFLITFEQYKKGFGRVLGSIDDYAQDISLFWNCMGKIMEPITEDCELPFVFLKELLQPCIPSEAAALLVSALLHCSAKRMGIATTKEFWRKSGLQWTDFLGAELNVTKFVQVQKLEFLVSSNVEHQMTSSKVAIEKVKQNLIKLLEVHDRNEMIYKYIDMRLWAFRMTEPSFIRALVLAVHEKAITGANRALNQIYLSHRMPLLKRYIHHNAHLELQALYALQSLMEWLRHPNGLLQQIFQMLYEADVITKETFNTWELSMDPNESKGKVAAVISVNIFLKAFKEADSGQESEQGYGGEQKQIDNESSCCVS